MFGCFLPNSRLEHGYAIKTSPISRGKISDEKDKLNRAPWVRFSDIFDGK